MTVPAPQAKAALRRFHREQLRQCPGEKLREESLAICRQIRHGHPWQEARAVMLFVPRPDEPDIWPLCEEALREGKVVVLPWAADPDHYLARRVTAPEAELVPGAFGIPEPGPHCPVWPLNQLDFVLVPGIAFSFDGGRVGRGRGYYDRLLAQVSGLTCGVAFECQLAADIPMEPHDIRLDGLVTPGCWKQASGDSQSPP